MTITTSYSWDKGPSTLLNVALGGVGSQFGPAVAANLAGDGYFTTWSDVNGNYQVAGRIFDAGQTPLTDEFTVNSFANLGSMQFDPSVTRLAGGKFVVTYTDFADDPVAGDIRGRLYASDGTALGSEFDIETTNVSGDTESSVAALSNGGFVVTCTRGNIGIRAGVYDQNGNNVSGSILVDPGAGQSATSVAGLSSGGFVAVWQDNGSDEVYFRRFQSNGIPLDAGRVLIDTAGSMNHDIHVAALADGGFAVAYTDNGWGIDGTEITFRIFNADGTTRTSFIRANNADFGGIEAGNQNRPTITTMGDLIVVGWRDADSSSSYVQVFDAQGHAVGDNNFFRSQVIEQELAGLANFQVADVWTSSLSEEAGSGSSIRTNVAEFMRTMTGDGADDVISGINDGLRERLVGGSGNDVLKGGGGGDELWGGIGVDMASYESASAGVVASLADPSSNTGDAAGDSYVSVEGMTGSAFDDVLTGNSGNNTLIGGAGNDTLMGLSGDDDIDGGDGNDMLVGGAGHDRIDGGTGDDTAAFALSFNAYTVQDFGAKLLVLGPAALNHELTSIEHLQFADVTITPADVANDGDPLFDTLYYLSRNPDVFQAGANAREHYNSWGWHEGRDPNALFDSSGYLAANPDVAASGMNPLEHYHQIGWQQGRDPGANFDTTLYLIHNPDVAAAGIDPLAHYLQFGYAEGRQAYQAIGQNLVNGFDAQYYLFHNPDVAAAGVDPLQHFQQFGWHEGRNPNGLFDTAGYLSHYADVAAAGINPFEHYMQFGWHEGRDPSTGFDTQNYLAANPDVAAAGVNALEHWLQHGIYEGRTLGNDGIWG
jgi:Ca2+-binding RTX toxin-like protein